MSLSERISPFIEKTDSCWLWTGDLNRAGYGRFIYGGKRWTAHRASYQVYIGDLPPVERGTKCCVLHRCDNPRCANPDHLFLGSQADNMRDKAEKGRAIGAHPGEKHHCAKLTRVQVDMIRAEPERKQEWIKLFGVARRTVEDVMKMKTWRK